MIDAVGLSHTQTIDLCLLVGCAAVLLSEWFAMSWRRPEDEGTTVRNVDTCSSVSTV